MGSTILCHSVKAKNPYEITRIHRKIYTLEELSYYLSHNIYLIDNTIMNDQFCNWLDEELELTELSYELKELLLERCTVTVFVLTILKVSDIYTMNDLLIMKDVLNKLNDLKEVERRKYKADNLLCNNEVEEAILVYQSILRDERDETISEEFYGKIYACLGASYGRAFLYQDAMNMYDRAFQICKDPALVKCYLYAAKKTMSETDYRLFVSKSEVYEEIEDILQHEIGQIENQLKIEPSDEILESWKKQYRIGNI